MPGSDALAYGAGAGDPAVAALLRDAGAADVEPAVHRDDEMLHWALWAHHGCRQPALVNYFRCGAEGWDAIRQVIRGTFAERSDLRILDFAAGYGRLTRFVVRDLPAGAVTVAEIDPAAVAFQRARLGVEGLVAPRKPEDFLPEERFDAVLAASFFSHLPAATFTAWLGRLWRLVAPGGLLVFSVHPEEALPPGRTMPAEGLYFEEVSESDSLERSEYGSSWVSEAFVTRAIREVADGRACHVRYPRALWNLQDLYAVGTSPGRLPPDLRLAPQGYVDLCELGPDGVLRLGGWATSQPPGGPPPEIEVTLGASPLGAVRSDLPRPDVAELVGAASPEAGWHLAVSEAHRFSPDDLLVVRASVASGRSAILHAGSLEATTVYVALARERGRSSALQAGLEAAKAEIGGLLRAVADESVRVAELDRRVHELGWQAHVLAERLRAMEASRFWKLRDRWFRWTGRRP